MAYNKHNVKRSFLTLLLTIMALGSFTSEVSANIIGFDFGSSFMKATLVKPGSPFSIVENTAS